MVTRGGAWFVEHPDRGRRPVLVLTRDAAIPVLESVAVASISRQVRDIPTEVVLDEDDGMPVRCAVSLDNLGEVWKALLIEHVTDLGHDRMREVCAALAVAVGC